MQPSTLNSCHGVSSSAHITTWAALHDPAGATDEEIVECVLRIWRDVSAAAAPRHAPSHPAMMHLAALRIFGHDSLQSSATLRRRYRQLAIRVHPDKNTSSQASEAFQLLQSCFEYLVSSREAEGSGGVNVAEQAAFQSTADPSTSTKRDAFRRGNAVNGEDAESYVSSSTSFSSTSSASSSPLSPPLSPVFSTGSRSSLGRSSLTHPRTAAAASAGRASPPRPPPPPSRRPASAAVSTSKGVLPSAPVPEPPDVFATSAGAPAAAVVPAPNVFDDSSSNPAVPPPPVFDAHPAFKGGSTGAAPPRIRRRASTGGCTSFAGAASDFGPAPPLVFEQASSAPNDTSAGGVIARRTGVATQHSSKQQRSTRQPELPTLAELLARLDADDDEDEGGSENIAEWTRGLSSRDGSNGSAARGYRTHETAAAKFSGPPTRLWSSTAHSGASQSRSNISDRADFESSGAPVTHRAAMKTDPVQLDMSCATPVSSAASSTPSTLEAFCNALQEEVRDPKYCHTPSASLSHMYSLPLAGSSVRSRRAGGGGVGGSSGSATRGWGSGGPAGERCACGKAPRGRCFLCEE
ncbi:conserved hypothetical protein [Leishmania mexicana MHOM/GT/2001/U1103]|uniref:J domain-containing protein n=1 Tax=Leishmania mexicana (strain MHOM/GT/2001/U1103) TaxID=929439 RepID=E9B009_LEIMU|nr:conserved hypothetical protein [Leishmania mexicana MHOM/GT/2001/U1103]CBZ28560.1 conserved hypothetical protein [Leishmania mexicana MHOM/GT/2001/U1103]